MRGTLKTCCYIVYVYTALMTFCIGIHFPNTVKDFASEDLHQRWGHQNNHRVKCLTVLRQRLLSLNTLIYLLFLSVVIFWCVEDSEMDRCERTEVSSVLHNDSYTKFLAKKLKDFSGFQNWVQTTYLTFILISTEQLHWHQLEKFLLIK